jgi:signal transduction histidine kinase/CheY-like chemotaxis protein/HPt (histidine-containing phosphotransfer) domain-containing protein
MTNEHDGPDGDLTASDALAPDNGEAGLTERVNHGCARILRRNAIPSVLTNIALSGLVAAIAWLQGHQTPAIAWFVTGFGINLIRIIIALNFDLNAEPSDVKVKRWPRLYAVITALSGGVWGAVGFLFIYPDQPEAATLFIVVVAGITAGAVSSSSPYFPALSWFLVPALIPLATALALRQEPLFYVIAGTLVVYLVMVLLMGRNINYTLRRSLEARFRQEALVSDLVRARDEAEVANRAKSEFLSSMSHEIRTPLHGILGIVELLRGGDLDETQRTRLDDAWDTCTALRTLVDDILDMGRIETGEVTLEMAPFDLGEMVENSRSYFEVSAREKGLTFEIETPLSKVEAVRGDRKRVRQILWVLLGNAVKFTPLGSVKLNLNWLDTNDIAPGVSILKVEVQDTGIGIKPDDLEKLFKPFVQVDLSTTRRFGGSGLGLAIVGHLVRLMGGKIFVQSVPWNGSTFTVEIPLERVDSSEIPNSSNEVAPAAEVFNYPLRILLAEDQALNALVATELITRHGHQIDHAPDGVQAVEAAAALDYDLILMDAHMPFMDGADATREIRASPFGGTVPIIAITADTLPSQFRKLMDAGVNDVVTKPYTDAELMAVVNRYGSRRSSVSEGTVSVSNGHVEDGQAIPASKQDWRARDETELKAFAINRPPEVVGNLLRLACESTKEQIEALREAIADNDPEAIFFSAHRIKGAAGSIFASELASLAESLEKVSRNPEEIAAIFPKIEAAALEALDWWAEREREFS